MRKPGVYWHCVIAIIVVRCKRSLAKEQRKER